MTRLCKCFDCIDDMEGKRPQALFCSEACRHRHWQKVNAAKRNAYQVEWRKPRRATKPYAGKERKRRGA